MISQDSFKSDGVHLNDVANAEVANKILTSIQFTNMSTFPRLRLSNFRADNNFPLVNKKRKFFESNDHKSSWKKVKQLASKEGYGTDLSIPVHSIEEEKNLGPGQVLENRIEHKNREQDLKKGGGQNINKVPAQKTLPATVKSIELLSKNEKLAEVPVPVNNEKRLVQVDQNCRDESVQTEFINNEPKLCNAIKHLKQELEDANNLIQVLSKTEPEACFANKLPESLRSKKISLSSLYTNLVSLEGELRDEREENKYLKLDLGREKIKNEELMREKDKMEFKVKKQTEIVKVCRVVFERSNRIDLLEEELQNEKLANVQEKQTLYKLFCELETSEDCDGGKLQEAKLDSGEDLEEQQVEGHDREGRGQLSEGQSTRNWTETVKSLFQFK